MTYQALRLQLAGPIARIVLARPDAANRVDDRLLRERAEAAAAIADSEGVVLAVLEAEGADFCRGWEESTRSRLLQAPPDDALVDPFGCLADLPCPVLAAVQGQGRSAGLELALAADIRLCADDAVFSLPEVGYGHLPLAGGSQRLPRVVGRGPAAAVLLLGQTLDAEAAPRARPPRAAPAPPPPPSSSSARRWTPKRPFAPASSAESSRETSSLPRPRPSPSASPRAVPSPCATPKRPSTAASRLPPTRASAS